MAFNIDADPINANWRRWKNWDVPVSSPEELLIFLGVEDASVEEQRSQVSKLKAYFDSALDQLQHELRVFLGETPSA